MCSSRPKIPKNSTPPAPLAPEASPDVPQIGEREQMARGRGMTIRPKVDLSGLGNQDVGTPVSRILIRPNQNTPLSGEDALAASEARAASADARAAEVERRSAPRGGRPTRGSGGRGYR